MEKFLIFLLEGIPESSLIIALSLALARVPLRWISIISFGTVLTVVIFFIRTMQFAMGLHFIVSLLLSVVFITTMTKVPPTKGFVVVSASSLVLAALELIVNGVLLPLFMIDPEIVSGNDLQWALLGLPQLAVMVLITLLVTRFNKPEQDAWKK